MQRAAARARQPFARVDGDAGEAPQKLDRQLRLLPQRLVDGEIELGADVFVFVGTEVLEHEAEPRDAGAEGAVAGERTDLLDAGLDELLAALLVDVAETGLRQISVRERDARGAADETRSGKVVRSEVAERGRQRLQRTPHAGAALFVDPDAPQRRFAHRGDDITRSEAESAPMIWRVPALKPGT